MANRNNRRQPSPGDLTGKIGAQQEAEHAEEIKAREGEISMARAAEVDMAQNGVFDPETGAPIEDDDAEDLTGPMGFGAPPQIGDDFAEEGDVMLVLDDEDGETEDYAEVIGAEDEVIEVDEPQVPRQQARQQIVEQRQPEPVQTAPGVQDRGVQVIDRPKADKVIVRINADIDQMTFGVGNHYSFQAGRKYKVPRALAQHLDRLGYVWH